jgi:hypothetical protein
MNVSVLKTVYLSNRVNYVIHRPYYIESIVIVCHVKLNNHSTSKENKIDISTEVQVFVSLLHAFTIFIYHSYNWETEEF